MIFWEFFMSVCPATEDFFRLRIDQMIDLRQPLAVLSSRMPWQEIEARTAHLFLKKAKTGQPMPDLDLFGEKPSRIPKPSAAGRPRLPLRLMVSLLYLKHAFNESDAGLVARWAETPSWQFFSGRAYFENCPPCDDTSLVKFRKLLGDEGVEELLAQTINVAVELELIGKNDLREVIVDTTVQPKAIAHPTDSRLLEVARTKLVQAAKDAGVALKQTFAKEGKELRFKAGRYAHAKQTRRLKTTLKRQRIILGRLQRDIERKAKVMSLAVRDALDHAMHKASRLIEQSQQRKTVKGNPKLYAWHAPEVECINKGKARQPYEFGVKVSVATTFNGNLIVGARAFHGNPYDGHTLSEQLDQATILMQDIDRENPIRPHTAFVDLGYRGVDADSPDVRIIHRGKFKSLPPEERRKLKRRQAVEPIIGHLKSDHRMNRCSLKGEIGDTLHAVLCATGYNLRWLLRMIARKGGFYAHFIFLRLFLWDEMRNDSRGLRLRVA